MPVPSYQDGLPPGLPPGVRARLWLRGDWLGLRNERWYLWLHLDDGRVLAFYLPEGAGPDDLALAELIAQVVTDDRGTLLEVRMGEGVAIPLYAAPAVALPRLALGRSPAWRRAALCRGARSGGPEPAGGASIATVTGTRCATTTAWPPSIRTGASAACRP
jgi:hypothetical protein